MRRCKTDGFRHCAVAVFVLCGVRRYHFSPSAPLSEEVVMNRRTILVSTGIAAVGIFGLGAYMYVPTVDKNAADETFLVRSHAPVLGPVDAPVTIVEFFDPACEACRAFHPYVKDIMSNFEGKVRVVLRYANFHPQSEGAIRILEAARMQGKFEVVLERLLETQPLWAPHGRAADSVWSVIAGTGLDITRAKKDALLPEVTRVLDQDASDVKAAGVKGTPTFFVNGKSLQEFGPQQLYELVRSEVEDN